MSPSRGLEGPLNILDIPIADISIVLRTALAQPAAHDAVLRRLLAAGRRLAKTDAWTEAALLDRLHYKNKNQHRRALYFRRFEEVRRVLRRLQKLRSGDAVDRLASLMKAEGTKRGDATWDRVPHQEHLAGVVYSLRTTAELLKKVGSVFFATSSRCSTIDNLQAEN